MMKHFSCLLAILITSWGNHAMAQTSKIVVLELFTSQGCSSCPPADALLRQLSNEDATLLTLSFHIDYWDNLGWKDPFSSRANTERQRNYGRNVANGEVFTPQLLIDGTRSVVGSQESPVRHAIAQAKKLAPQATVQFEAAANTGQMTIAVSPAETLPNDATVDVLVVHYSRMSNTEVNAGENRGRKLANVNNVTSIERIGSLQNSVSRFTIAKPDTTRDGLAVVVQKSDQGPILGAGFFQGG